MKRFAIPVLIALLLSASFSCRKDFSTLSSTGNLTFSKDTVFLDTIFTNISSSTYAVKVYNKSSDDIHIPAINLGRSPSFYRLNVDGVPGTSFENVPLRADDSLYIFIEATIDYTKISEPIYKDSIVFDSGETLQDIKLITQVVDSHFLYPRDNFRGMLDSTYVKDIRGDSLRERKLSSEELHFKNDKPYVIYGYCTVPENETLTIDAGAKIYFHKKSALVVKKNASIRIEGTADQKVHFEGDRLEPGFSEVAGQWDALWLQAGSKNNLIEHALIKNAGIGIRCDSISSNGTPTLELKNTEIYNSSEQGLLALGSHVRAENVVIGNSRKASVALSKGGTYNFNHCTLANYWSGSFRRDATVQISNTAFNLDKEGKPIETTQNLNEATFSNCIIDGSNARELFLDKNATDLFAYKFENCLIKFVGTESADLYDFDNTDHYESVFVNEDPYFKDPIANEFQIGEESEAIEKAGLENALKTPLDLIGTDRTIAPDLGAYQHIIFEEEEEEEEEEEM